MSAMKGRDVREEIVLPFEGPRAQIPVVTHVRGTVLSSSMRGLRAHNLFEQYLAHLRPSTRDLMVSLTAGRWVSIDVAHEHYAACQSLGLDRKVIEAIGFESGRVINETVLSVAVRLSKEVGVTPWTAIVNGNKLRSRTWQGGSFCVTKLGPKEARVEWAGQTLGTIPYFRVAFGAFTQGILSLFSRTVFWRDLPNLCSETVVAYRFSWV